MSDIVAVESRAELGCAGLAGFEAQRLVGGYDGLHGGGDVDAVFLSAGEEQRGDGERHDDAGGADEEEELAAFAVDQRHADVVSRKFMKVKITYPQWACTSERPLETGCWCCSR